LSLYTGDRYVAEELAQETLVRVCERWGEVQAMDAPGGWAHRVGFNLANSRFRRLSAERRARRRLDAVVDGPAHEIDTADALALRAAVSDLAEPQRSVLLLRYYADLPVAEVATLLDCPENTVKTHARRAITRLRSAGLLGDDDGLEAGDVG
jgi:RNA polymerase sigma-70 factor (ECF subfamily)